MGSVGASGEAEPVAPDHGAVLHDDPVADSHTLADRDARVDDAVVAEHRTASDCDVRVNDGPCADAHAVLDHGERPNRCVWRHERARCHIRARMDAWREHVRRSEQADGTSERHIGFASAKHRAWCVFGTLAEDDGRCTSQAQLGRILRVGKERQVAGTRIFDSGNSSDLNPAVAFEYTAEALGDLLQLQKAAP